MAQRLSYKQAMEKKLLNDSEMKRFVVAMLSLKDGKVRNGPHPYELDPADYIRLDRF
jgi:hypothetical protein